MPRLGILQLALRIVATMSAGSRLKSLIGAARISVFPITGHLAFDPQNFILVHATSANTAGQPNSIIAGVLLALVAARLPSSPDPLARIRQLRPENPVRPQTRSPTW